MAARCRSTDRRSREIYIQKDGGFFFTRNAYGYFVCGFYCNIIVWCIVLRNQLTTMERCDIILSQRPFLSETAITRVSRISRNRKFKLNRYVFNFARIRFAQQSIETHLQQHGTQYCRGARVHGRYGILSTV